ncbi:MAG: hypothetical protein KDC52_15310 [Ignavibacteriae bacterium]|nr:hypothetical protein [Ignavibacteriota bacterium]
MEKEISCNLKPVEKRLYDSFDLWSKAYEQYFNPNQFRISLNSAIQELRNVTFILQKNKNVIQDFDQWYSE